MSIVKQIGLLARITSSIQQLSAITFFHIAGITPSTADAVFLVPADIDSAYVWRLRPKADDTVLYRIYTTEQVSINKISWYGQFYRNANLVITQPWDEFPAIEIRFYNVTNGIVNGTPVYMATIPRDQVTHEETGQLKKSNKQPVTKFSVNLPIEFVIPYHQSLCISIHSDKPIPPNISPYMFTGISQLRQGEAYRYSAYNNKWIYGYDSVNMELSGNVIPNSCADVIGGSASSFPIIVTDLDVENPIRQSIAASFTPNFGLSLSVAAQICGVHHFNYRSYITSVPLAWETEYNGIVVKATGDEIDPPGLLDPPLGGMPGKWTDPRIGITANWLATECGVDNNVSYYDDTCITQPGVLSSTSLEFIDSPFAPPGFYAEGEYMEFFTELVGVDEDGAVVSVYAGMPSMYNAGFFWRSDQTSDFRGGLYLATSNQARELNPGHAFAGGLSILRVVNPLVDIHLERLGNDLRVYWQDVGSQVQLEASNQVSGPWSKIEFSQTAIHGVANVQISTTNRNQFFRLRFP